MMANKRPQLLDVWLDEQLPRLLPKGARAEQILEISPQLVDKLCPAESHPDLGTLGRAEIAEQRFGEAIDNVGSRSDWRKPVSQALRYLFALANDPEAQGVSLQ